MARTDDLDHPIGIRRQGGKGTTQPACARARGATRGLSVTIRRLMSVGGDAGAKDLGIAA